MAIQRTRTHEVRQAESKADSALHEILNRVLQVRIEALVSQLNETKSFAEQNNISRTLESIHISLHQLAELQHQLSFILQESANHHRGKATDKHFRYPSSPLTNRELELLMLVKRGHTNKQIAETLYISERTVKFHITSILSKLNASTRTEAVDIALKRGIIGF